MLRLNTFLRSDSQKKRNYNFTILLFIYFTDQELNVLLKKCCVHHHDNFLRLVTVSCFQLLPNSNPSWDFEYVYICIINFVIKSQSYRHDTMYTHDFHGLLQCTSSLLQCSCKLVMAPVQDQLFNILVMLS